MHSLWQIAVIAGGYALLGALLRRRSAQARYLCGCVAMLAMVAGPVTTWLLLPFAPAALAPLLWGCLRLRATPKRAGALFGTAGVTLLAVGLLLGPALLRSASLID